MTNRPNQTSMRDFFGSDGVQTVRTRKPKHKVLVKLASLTSLMGVAVIMGLIGMVFPMIAVSSTIIVVEPATAVWKNISDELPKVDIAERNIFYDKNGAPFAEVWTEDRIELESLDQISEYAKDGLISAEDKRFYEHKGFDILGTLRAAQQGNGGGSGITQQLIKNLLFYNLLGKEENKKLATEKSYDRKLRELKLAMSYEKKYTKDEILLTYFNTVAFGSPNIYGIEAASQYFFGKSAKDLDMAEAAALIGTVQNPVKFDMKKLESRQDWRARQKLVLDRMAAEGVITKGEAAYSKAVELEIQANKKGNGNCSTSKYPFYCKYTLEFLENSYRLGETQEDRDAIIARGGLQVKTHLDPAAMEVSERLLKEGYGTGNRIIAPTAIVEPGTGGVLSIAQNREWGQGGEEQTEIVVPTVPSGEGSVYKIFTLAAALNTGLKESDLTFSSQCPLQPGPDFDAPPNGFKNSNSCELQGGELDYRQATAFSSNTWYVTLEMKIGVNAVKEFSKSVGLAAPDYMGPRSLAYTLGVVGNSPVDVAAASATFANKGVYCPPTPVKELTYGDGTSPAYPDSYNLEMDACRAVMSPKSAGIVLKAMRANVSGEIPGAFGLAANIPGQDTVGKSGTNQDQSIAWVQLTSQYSIYTNTYDLKRPKDGVRGVWFRGYSRGSENTAKLVDSDILRELLAGTPNKPLDFNNPDSEFKKTVLDESNFFTIPSVVGLQPEEAVDVLQSLGVLVKISKTYKNVPLGYPADVVVEQSIPAGDKLAKGSNKEMILYIGR